MGRGRTENSLFAGPVLGLLIKVMEIIISEGSGCGIYPRLTFDTAVRLAAEDMNYDRNGAKVM